MERSMAWVMLLTILTVLILLVRLSFSETLPLERLKNQNPKVVKIRYAIKAGGKKVGTTTAIRTLIKTRNSQILKVTESTDLKFKWFFISSKMTSSEDYILKNNQLVQYRFRYDDGKRKTESFIIKKGNLFIEERKEGGKVKKIRHPLEIFNHFSVNYLPVHGKSISSYDIETGKIIKTSYFKIREETIKAGRREFKCSVFRAKSEKNETKIWFSKNFTGYFPVRITGEEDGLKYTVDIESYNTTWKKR